MTESREYIPQSPILKQFIHSYWTLKTAPGKHQHAPCLVAPEPYLECLLSFKSDTIPLNSKGEGSRARGHLLLGIRTEPYNLQPRGAIDYLSIRFHPHGLRPFLGLSCRELTNSFTELETLKVSLKELIAPIMEKALTDLQRISFVERALLKLLSGRSPLPSPALCHTISSIRASRGSLRLNEYCRETGIGLRQLNREFERFVGISPKHFSRITRFSHLLRELTSPAPAANLANLAYDCGYFDQAHMIRECSEFTGLTPGALQTLTQSVSIEETQAAG